MPSMARCGSDFTGLTPGAAAVNAMLPGNTGVPSACLLGHDSEGVKQDHYPVGNLITNADFDHT